MAAGDFYFAINATFRFFLQHFGREGLIQYWRSLGSEYYAPLAERFRTGGLDEVSDYWRRFFAEEPGAVADVTRQSDAVQIDVHVCPAIAWLRQHDRQIVPLYCEHCEHVSKAIAERAGMEFELQGGGELHPALCTKVREGILMIGVQDFCGHYDWTFEYIRRTYGEEVLRQYWVEAIAEDSQRHAGDLMQHKGIAGMKEYWGHTLEMEEAGYALTATPDVFRIDMHECPSKGYLLQHGLEAYHDYCAHCMGWIGHVAQKAGFTVDHEHNHRGQCWWELRAKGTPATDEAGQLAGEKNVALRSDWALGKHDVYQDCELIEKNAPLRSGFADEAEATEDKPKQLDPARTQRASDS